MSEANTDKTDKTRGGRFPWLRKERRAEPFIAEQEKFSTQRKVTYFLLVLFAAVVAQVLTYSDDQSERSTVLQTVINMVIAAVSYWLGASKRGEDQAQAMSKIAEAAAPAAVVAADKLLAATGAVLPKPVMAAADARKLLADKGMSAEDVAKLTDAEAVAAATASPGAVTPAPMNPETGVTPAAEVAPGSAKP